MPEHVPAQAEGASADAPDHLDPEQLRIRKDKRARLLAEGD